MPEVSLGIFKDGAVVSYQSTVAVFLWWEILISKSQVCLREKTGQRERVCMCVIYHNFKPSLFLQLVPQKRRSHFNWTRAVFVGVSASVLVDRRTGGQETSLGRQPPSHSSDFVSFTTVAEDRPLCMTDLFLKGKSIKRWNIGSSAGLACLIGTLVDFCEI